MNVQTAVYMCSFNLIQNIAVQAPGNHCNAAALTALNEGGVKSKKLCCKSDTFQQQKKYK